MRSLLKPKRGTRLGFSRRVRDKAIGKLLDIASAILIRKVAKRAFDRVHDGSKRRRIKGRGLDARGKDLVRFARRMRGPIMYTFWRGKQCLYVGKGRKPSRLAGYQRHGYQREAVSVKVFSIRAKSKLPSAECLAVHLFQPKYNRHKPERGRWGRKCPVCRRHDEIKTLLWSMFPMR